MMNKLEVQLLPGIWIRFKNVAVSENAVYRMIYEYKIQFHLNKCLTINQY